MRMNKKGFTLVELMIVLAILGLLAGIGIPSYVGVLNRARIGADIARIAEVQSAVNALIAECGGVGNVYYVDADDVPHILTGAAAGGVFFKDLIGTSVIVGGDSLSLVSEYLADDLTAIRGLMQSTAGKSADGWYVDPSGTITLGTDADHDVFR